MIIKNVLAILFIISSAQARVHDFQTTRLKSTAGAGVASILFDEGTILNPASMAFYEVSSVYAQRSNHHATLNVDNGKVDENQKSYDFIITDGHSGGKASASYIRQKEVFDQRTRYSLAYAQAIHGNSAIGGIVRRTVDSNSRDGITFEEKKYNQMVFGFTQVINPEFSFGTVFVDPLKASSEDSKVITGFQYNYRDFITLMIDLKTNYYQDFASNFGFAGGAQVKILNDFFLRFGYFKDGQLDEDGTGGGLSWVQPKLSAEVAVKNTNIRQKNYEGKIRELAFSLSFRF